MSDSTDNPARRAALTRSAKMLAGIGVAVVLGQTGIASAAKKKSAKDDFYFQETPNDDGKACSGCANLEPYSAGNPKATTSLLAPEVAKESEKGTCALLEGEVCTHCYCQGWVDKKTGKKAGT